MGSLFHNNPVQNEMSKAYANMLKEETDSGKIHNTANFFEDILVEDDRSSLIPEGAVTRNEDGTIRIMMESVTAEQWNALKALIRV